MDNSKKPNHLINATSPYLLQHAYNPVNWYQWGPEALNCAKIIQSADDISNGITKSVKITPGKQDLSADILENAYQISRRTFDKDNGGFGHAPKFPPISCTRELFVKRWTIFYRGCLTMPVAFIPPRMRTAKEKRVRFMSGAKLKSTEFSTKISEFSVKLTM